MCLVFFTVSAALCFDISSQSVTFASFKGKSAAVYYFRLILSIYRKILKEHWGYDNFRPLQEEIIASVGSGHDTLGLMPTGGGKSITFQVPALAMEGLCLVVTPLIALMKDQVDNLKKRGIKAAAIYSGMTRQDILLTLDNCILGGYKFLYISPERLGTELFITKIRQAQVCMIAVDESHCISQWGYDFRPSYLKIAEIRDIIPDAPILALTATATPEVVDDIQAQLKFRNGKFFKKSFARKNIAYIVRHTDDKYGSMLNILNKVPGTSIVYVRNRKKTKEIADYLVQQGISADNYHAGLTNESKDQKQNAWKDGSCRVIVATNAFGMGIDKPDVRTVIHLDLPDTLEAYFQEAGRAGRDEKTAYAVLLFNRSDSTKLKKRISDNFPDKEFVRKVYCSVFNFYEIGEGYGLERMYEFSLANFCSAFKLNVLQTYSALKILEQGGYLELTEEANSGSRVMFTTTKEDLYHQNISKETEELMKLILRSYTGLFAEYAYIDELMLASKLNMSREQIYESLTLLRKMGIIDYVPDKKTAYIIFKQERLDPKYVNLGKKVYDDCLERFEKRISKVLEYATDDFHCRSKLLLSYFGETDSEPCNVCDICRNKGRRRIADDEVEAVRAKIAQILSTSQKLPIFSLRQQASDNDELAKLTIRWMLDEKLLIMTDDNMVSLPE